MMDRIAHKLVKKPEMSLALGHFDQEIPAIEPGQSPSNYQDYRDGARRNFFTSEPVQKKPFEAMFAILSAEATKQAQEITDAHEQYARV
jgi:hypothetical protein